MKDFLFDMVRQGTGDPFSLASLAAYMDNNTSFQHNHRMLNAQREAYLRCIHGDDYEPPKSPGEDGDGMSTIISGNFIADAETLNAILESQKKAGDSEDTKPEPEPEEPPVAKPVQVEVNTPIKVTNTDPPPPPPKPTPLWKKVAAAGALATGGAGLVAVGMAINNWMQPDPVDPSVYDVRAIPWTPEN